MDEIKTAKRIQLKNSDTNEVIYPESSSEIIYRKIPNGDGTFKIESVEATLQKIETQGAGKPGPQGPPGPPSVYYTHSSTAIQANNKNAETLEGRNTQELILNKVYPIGSIYMSVSNVSPENFIGGKWEQILGRFLLATGTSSANSDNYFGEMSGKTWSPGLGSTGGQDYHISTEEEMPKHAHSIRYGMPDGSGVSISHDGTGYRTLDITNWSWVDNNMDGNIFTSYNGKSQPHNNMPPYLAVNMWKRIS